MRTNVNDHSEDRSNSQSKINEIVLFRDGEDDYPMEIVDANRERWVTSTQLGKALGVQNVHALQKRLENAGELKEGLHFSSLKLENSATDSKRGNPTKTVYSYRGVIRMAMRSSAKRAIAFRDWAEDILYDAMTRKGQQASGTDDKTLGVVIEHMTRMTEVVGTLVLALNESGALNNQRVDPPVKKKWTRKTYSGTPVPGKTKTGAILDVLKSTDKVVHLSELYDTVGARDTKEASVIRSLVHKLVNKGDVSRVDVGFFIIETRE